MTRNSFLEHILYVCCKCKNYETSKKSNLIRHERTCESNKCDKCGIYFKSKQSLKIHMKEEMQKEKNKRLIDFIRDAEEIASLAVNGAALSFSTMIIEENSELAKNEKKNTRAVEEIYLKLYLHYAY